MEELLKDIGLAIPTHTAWRIVETITAVVVLTAIRFAVSFFIGRRCSDMARCYFLRRNTTYVYAALLTFAIAHIWVSAFGSFATVLGLAGAGVAIALHDVLANISGFAFIISRKPFQVGDRIEIGGTAGDVIDIRLFQFSVIEIGNWVDADQSTGRIVHIPNSRAFREPLANYTTGFEYIWHEIPVVVTFESDWEKAKGILKEISETAVELPSKEFESQIRRASMKYLIYFKHLTPIVYTSVVDHGVRLTMRFIVKPRQRRGSDEAVWEAILRAFAQHDDIDLAYPTTRFYAQSGQMDAERD